jgi:hypothetical protein
MNEEITAYDLRFNLMAFALCIYKRGHPNVTYEEDWELFDNNYIHFEKDYYSPEEVLNNLQLIF